MKRELISNGVHDYTEKDNYVYPQNPEVAKHLEWFRGLKLGFMMHWSPASQLGTYESWPLSDGDAHCERLQLHFGGNSGLHFATHASGRLAAILTMDMISYQNKIHTS